MGTELRHLYNSRDDGTRGASESVKPGWSAAKPQDWKRKEEAGDKGRQPMIYRRYGEA